MMEVLDADLKEAGMGSGVDNNAIRLAVVTGGHPYDAMSFGDLMRSLPGVCFDVQSVQDICTDFGDYVRHYDVIVFYNMTQQTPQDKYAWDCVSKEKILQIFDRGQGVCLLHHSILAFPDWPLWGEVCGIADRSFKYHMSVDMDFKVMSSDHPITRELDDFSMIDEAYEMNSADDSSAILLSADHPKSMKSIAWTRRFGQSKVFCYESGHDKQAFNHPRFREILYRGILWLADRDVKDVES
jgi:uncharacterized protein